MNEIPDITDTERWIVETTFKQRYGEPEPELRFADAAIPLNPADRGLTTCLVLFREANGCIAASFYTAGTNGTVPACTSTTTPPNARSRCCRHRQTMPPVNVGTWIPKIFTSGATI